MYKRVSLMIQFFLITPTFVPINEKKKNVLKRQQIINMVLINRVFNCLFIYGNNKYEQTFKRDK